VRLRNFLSIRAFSAASHLAAIGALVALLKDCTIQVERIDAASRSQTEPEMRKTEDDRESSGSAGRSASLGVLTIPKSALPAWLGGCDTGTMRLACAS
jgi:hypothetical protein